MGVTILLAAAKLGRIVLSQFVRCEHCRWNARVQNCASSVQFMCREQSSLHFIYPEVQMKRAYLLYNATYSSLGGCSRARSGKCIRYEMLFICRALKA